MIDTVPELNATVLKFAFVEAAALVTVNVYDFVVVPSCAVTSVVIVFEPTFRLINLLAVTAVVFTLTVAFACDLTGVIVVLVEAYGTVAVYVVVALEKVGLKAPPVMERLLKSALLDRARLTVKT